jgi:hypothetical protein
MEKIIEVKEKLQELDYKAYSIHQLEPKFQDFFGGTLVCRKDNIKFMYLDENKIATLLELNYADIANVHIDNILVDIKMKNGIVYHLHQLRQDLFEILKDFKGQYLSIENKQAIHVLQCYEVVKKNNILNITGAEMDEYNVSKPFRYAIDLNTIDNICEDYLGEEEFREVFINLENGKELAIWTE